jgi:hypothetical protein
MIKMDWLAAGVTQRAVSAVLVLVIFLSRREQFAQPSSQWEARIDHLKKYP